MGKKHNRYSSQNSNKKESKKEAALFYPTHPDKEIDGRLYHLLANATPHGHEHVLKPWMPKGYQQDAKGNMIYRVGKTKEHKTMFSCHMDTVHAKPIVLIPHMNQAGYCMAWTRTDKGLDQCVLGADDKLGMYIMLRMMEAKIPGLYVFHVGEECGGLGSKFIIDKSPGIVDGVDRCIAFDRKDYTDVITRQRGGECASKVFADALADQLNYHLGTEFSKYVPDPTGVYTDSAEYTHLVGECTNLSVGYFNAHTSSEKFDHYWLETLLIPALIKIEWQSLPTHRKPQPKTTSYTSYHGGTYYGGGGGTTRSSNAGDWTYVRNKTTGVWEKVPAQSSFAQGSLPFTPSKKEDQVHEAWLERCNATTFESGFKDLPVYDFFTQGLIEGVNKESMIALIYHDFWSRNQRTVARIIYNILYEWNWERTKVGIREKEITDLKAECRAKDAEIAQLKKDLAAAKENAESWQQQAKEVSALYNDATRKLEICQEQVNGQNTRH